LSKQQIIVTGLYNTPVSPRFLSKGQLINYGIVHTQVCGEIGFPFNKQKS